MPGSSSSSEPVAIPEGVTTRYTKVDVAPPAPLPETPTGWAGPAPSRRFGKYELLARLGQGGMGVVYKARQEGFDRVVALKVILSGADAHSEARSRFKVEAQAVARLDHPGIIAIHEIDEVDGQPYFTMDYLDGGDLAGWTRSGPLSPREAARLVALIADAVQYAHERGVIHRDLKPSNILLRSQTSQTGSIVPVVTDFGLAKLLDASCEQTPDGRLLGTPAFMAPEQAAGRNRDITFQTDVYGLGAILYTLLSGRPPFEAPAFPAVLQQVMHRDPSSLRSKNALIPRDLDVIALKCLQKEARRRYATASDLATELRRFLAGEPIQARPARVVERAIKWTRRNPGRATLAAASATLVVLVGLGLASYRHQREQEARQRAEATQEIAQLLIQARGERADGRLDEARASLERGIALLQAQPTQPKDEQREKLGQDLEEQRQQVVAQQLQHQRHLEAMEYRRVALARLEEFRRLYSRALADEASADLLGLGSPEGVSRAARTALAHYDLDRPPEWEGDYELPSLVRAHLTPTETKQLLLHCHALLLTWATAEWLAGRNEPSLRLLIRAEKLVERFGLTTRLLHRRRAEVLERLGQAAAAHDERQRAEAHRPQGFVDWFLTAQDEYLNERYPESLRACREAIASEPEHDPLWAHFLQALCRLRRREWELARADLTLCLNLDRQFLWARLLRAYATTESRTQRDDALAIEAAQEDFDEVVRRADTPLLRYAARMYRGVFAVQNGKGQEALKDLQEAITLRPEAAPAHANLAAVRAAQADQARVPLAVSLVLLGEGRLILGQAARAYAQAQSVEAQRTLARDDLNRAIALAPRSADLYRRRSRLLRASLDLEGARADLEHALTEEKEPRARTSDLVELAALDVALRDFDRTLQRCDAALAEAKRARLAEEVVGEVYWLRARALQELGREKEARAAVARFLELPVRRPTASHHEARAILHALAGNLTGAIEEYTLALQLAPHDPNLRCQRGRTYLVAGALPLARDEFETVLASHPAHVEARCGRGLVLARQGRTVEARADAERVRACQPREANPYLQIACIYALACRDLETRATWRDRVLLADADHCRQQALEALSQALERTPNEAARARLYQTRIRPEPDLNRLKGTSEFAEWERRLGQGRSSPER